VIRIPLISPVDAVVHRLDVAATAAQDPPGGPATGYQPILKEPYPFLAGDDRRTTRTEMAAIRIPCQYHEMTTYQLNMEFAGSADMSRQVLVFHRMDLERLGLIDATTGNVLLKNSDRVSQLELRGNIVRRFADPTTPDYGLFVYEVKDKSWGAGPQGYDLAVCYFTNRPRTSIGR